jgi:hypothetical protein
MSRRGVPALVPDPEPELVVGRPRIYVNYFQPVNGAYVGKNDSGDPNYQGSPQPQALKRISDAYAQIGITTGPHKSVQHMLWSPPGATIAECHNQEWIWIARFRAHHDGPVFNVFPIEDFSDHFNWEHDPLTHVERATNSRWRVMYVKMSSWPDSQGNCVTHDGHHPCARPWGDQTPGAFWCKKIYLDEDNREEWLIPPSTNVKPITTY